MCTRSPRPLRQVSTVHSTRGRGHAIPHTARILPRFRNVVLFMALPLPPTHRTYNSAVCYRVHGDRRVRRSRRRFLLAWVTGRGQTVVDYFPRRTPPGTAVLLRYAGTESGRARMVVLFSNFNSRDHPDQWFLTFLVHPLRWLTANVPPSPPHPTDQTTPFLNIPPPGGPKCTAGGRTVHVKNHWVLDEAKC